MIDPFTPEERAHYARVYEREEQRWRKQREDEAAENERLRKLEADYRAEHPTPPIAGFAAHYPGLKP